MACERQRNKRLTIGSLAEHGRILRGDADRMFAFLGQARIIDDQIGVGAPNEFICLPGQFLFNRPGVPNPVRDEMMQPVITIRRDARRHRLDAFAIARSDQARHIQRAHLPPLFVAQLLNERLQPVRQRRIPIRHNPRSHESAKPRQSK